MKGCCALSSLVIDMDLDGWQFRTMKACFHGEVWNVSLGGKQGDLDGDQREAPKCLLEFL